jgi:hypothetical protein
MTYREEAFPQHLLDQWSEDFLRLWNADPHEAAEVLTIWEARLRSTGADIPPHTTSPHHASWVREHAHRCGRWPLIDVECATRMHVGTEVHIVPHDSPCWDRTGSEIFVVRGGVVAKLFVAETLPRQMIENAKFIIESVADRDDHYIRILRGSELLLARFFAREDVRLFPPFLRGDERQASDGVEG